MKASPSLKGVVIGKDLFSKTKKDQAQKDAEKIKLQKLEDDHKVNLNKLKTRLVDKLDQLVRRPCFAGRQYDLQGIRRAEG